LKLKPDFAKGILSIYSVVISVGNPFGIAMEYQSTPLAARKKAIPGI
jgi:hypothetical protein